MSANPVKAYLETIAAETMQDWTRREIFSMSEAVGQDTCKGSISCMLDRKLDWRQERLKMLHLTADFTTAAQYEAALADSKSREVAAKSKHREGALKMLTAMDADDLEDGVDDILQPAVLLLQTGALMHLAFAFNCLSGNKPEKEFLNLAADTQGGVIMKGLYDIMREKGVYSFWNGLMALRS